MVIKQPIDLREIHDKIRSGGYSTVEDMMEDVELLVNNACTFNEEDSLVYAVSKLLNHTANLKPGHNIYDAGAYYIAGYFTGGNFHENKICLSRSFL